MSARLTLILGGARSGKSRLAESLAAASAGPVTYLAGLRCDDDEMRRRVALHQARRPADWTTLEAPDDPAAALRGRPAGGVILIDCLGTFVAGWLGNDLPDTEVYPAELAADRETRVLRRTAELLEAGGDTAVILVSNEVGCGLVPPFPLGRLFRDALGRANVLAADRADAVALCVAGLPLWLKGGPA